MYYQTQEQAYGVPLDDRATFTKIDWLSWIAAMGDPVTFDDLFSRIYAFAHQTPTRIPLSGKILGKLFFFV